MSRHDEASVGRIYSRRDILALGATTGAALLLPMAWSRQGASQRPLVASPAMTEGPFFVDERLGRSNILGDTKRAAVTSGIPLLLEVTVLKLVGSQFKPFEQATVDIWHADLEGKYSDVSHPMNHEDTKGENWLRGFQNTDTDGKAKFETVFPGWYPGRAPHIHFKIRKHDKASNRTADFTSQWFFTTTEANQIYKSGSYASRGVPNVPNERDNIYNERAYDGKTAGQVMTLPLGKLGRGYESKFTVVLTDKNFAGEDLNWALF